MRTIRLAEFDGGLVYFETDFDDSAKRITMTRCVDNGRAEIRTMLAEPMSWHLTMGR